MLNVLVACKRGHCWSLRSSLLRSVSCWVLSRVSSYNMENVRGMADAKGLPVLHVPSKVCIWKCLGQVIKPPLQPKACSILLKVISELCVGRFGRYRDHAEKSRLYWNRSKIMNPEVYKVLCGILRSKSLTIIHPWRHNMICSHRENNSCLAGDRFLPRSKIFHLDL